MADASDDNQQSDSEASGGMLLYTVAFDAPGVPQMRFMAKMLAASAVRASFDGAVMIFHNSPQPILILGRPGVEEFPVKTLPLDAEAVAGCAHSFKAAAAAHIEPERYRWVLVLDAECLILRSIDHLFADRDCDILYQPGISGVLAVRGYCYETVMAEWARMQQPASGRSGEPQEQNAWNRLISEAAQHGWRAEPFEPHEIQFPLSGDPDWKLYKDAAIVHCHGVGDAEKIRFMFGLFMQRFFHDPACTVLNLLEM